ncbi:MAG: class B sortase [Eubacterium sp.]|nr:class B sortase [Eubacterium sp.]
MGQSQKKKKISPVLIIVILICLAVLGFSAYKLISTMLEYKRGTDEYNGLRGYTEEQAEDSSLKAEGTESDAAVLRCPISVDFDALKAINEDIVGWLYIKTLDISYPIVQGEDNSFYLHQTFEKKYNFAGSIFMDMDNRSDFEDPNTIIYGHNMKNDSMFGRLDEYFKEDADTDDPHFWILVPGAEYCYDMFSMDRVDPSGEVYTLFSGADETFVEYARKRAAASVVELPPQEFTTNSKIVTLSTCTGDSVARYVVQGVRTVILRHGK